MLEASGRERRRTVRIVPRTPVIVEMASESCSTTHGVVVDISEGGACVRADPCFGVGDLVVGRLRVAPAPDSLPVTGRVVWNANGPASRCALEWTHAGPQRDRLRALIHRLG
jgi:PilZ domain-containing protein